MNKTVLVIDDDKMLRDTLATSLRKSNFNVITAESAEEANKILSRIAVDAIILDRMMSGTDGLTFLKQLRSKGNLTPVIMLTAMTGPDNTIDGLSGGANDYMAKPFSFQELVLRLNNIIKVKPETTNLSDLGIELIDNEFFIKDINDKTNLLNLSQEEKKLLKNLTTPVGNIVAATPMVAKRLRNKINDVLSDIDIITVRGTGYKIITTKKQV